MMETLRALVSISIEIIARNAMHKGDIKIKRVDCLQLTHESSRTGTSAFTEIFFDFQREKDHATGLYHLSI